MSVQQNERWNTEMKRKIFSKILLVGLCVFGLAGCANPTSDVPQTPTQSTNENDSYEKSNNADEMLNSANLNGSVLDFSDLGCSVTPVEIIENGAGSQVSADGYENEDNTVTVNYNSDCEFIIATLSGETNSITSMTNGSASDVKKQSQIFVYGNYVDTYTLNADKIIIARFE